MAVDITTETVIARPCEQVAAYAGDPSNAPQWYANISSVRWQTPPPIAVVDAGRSHLSSLMHMASGFPAAEMCVKDDKCARRTSTARTRPRQPGRGGII
jgi:hypothetical protein